MESYLQSIILGLVQGISEFFPVSSSGHLVLAQWLMGLREPEIILDLMLHLGTLTAVLLFLRKEITLIIKSLVTSGEEGASGRKLLLLLIVACIPTAIAGLCFRSTFINMFNSLLTVGAALVITGLLLALTRIYQPKRNLDIKGTPWFLAFIIGLAQGLAITPGLSRSGATISAGLFLGLNRELAFKFSFLISIPAIVGAAMLEWLHLGQHSSQLGAGPIMAGTLVAAGSGLLALNLMNRLVKKGQLFCFAPYCLAIGILAVFLGWGM